MREQLTCSPRAWTSLPPRREAHPGSGAGWGAVARDVFEPAEVDALGSARDRDPVEDFRASRLELASGQSLQEGAVLVGERLEDGAVEFLIHQEVAQAPRGQHAHLRVTGIRLDRPAHRLAELVAAAWARLVGRKISVEEQIGRASCRERV